MKLSSVVLAASLAVPAAAKAGQPPRVLGYRLAKKRRPSKVALAQVTHVVDRSGGDGSAEVVAEARAAGKGVLLGVVGLSRGAEAVAAAVEKGGYDGVDVDLTDVGADMAGAAQRLVARVRELLPRPKLVTAAVNPHAPAFASLAADLDQETLLADETLEELEREAARFVAAGAPREKLGISIWLEGYAALAERLDIKEYDYSDPRYRWDAARQAAFRGEIRYENEASIRRKAEFVRREGMAGIAAWDLSGAERRTQPERRRDLLPQELKRAAAGEPSSPIPAAQPGEPVFVDSLEGGPDVDAWVSNGKGFRTRRLFAGVTVSLRASGSPKADACVLGLHAGPRGRYCVALSVDGAVLRKIVLEKDGAERSYDLSPRMPLPAAGERRVSASIRDGADGRVMLTATVDGQTLQAVDDGTAGGAPLSGAGALALPSSGSGLTESSLEAVLLPTAAPARPLDAGVPVLSGVDATVTAGTAKVTWTTSEPTDARVEYGITDAYGSTATATSGGLGLSHSVTLPSLQPGKTYHYRVLSRDAAGNLAQSDDHTIVMAGGTRYAVASDPAPAPAEAPSGVSAFYDAFDRADGLITNEFAHFNSGNASAVKSPDWDVTSGSLFIQDHAAWTGIPDGVGPNAGSSNGTDSAVFRLTTKRSDFADAAVQFSLLNQGLTTTARTPAVAWDGCHIFLRYRSEYELYYASINRRDNTVIIKKKVPGGPSNGGTYYNLSPLASNPVPYNRWQQIMATVRDNPDGSVTIALYSEGRLLVQAVDDGSLGGAPLRGSGKVGIRGDNANLKFDDFRVTALAPDGQPAPAPGSGGTTPPVQPGGGVIGNLSLYKEFSASSFAGLGVEPDRANDGDAASRWQSIAQDSEWLMADLGIVYQVSGATIRWDANYALAYEVQVSQDGGGWTTVYTKTGGAGGDENVVFTPTAARFVRVMMTQRSRSDGYGIRELEVQGTAPAGADVTPPQITDIEATGVASADGTMTINWKTDKPSDSRVDFGQTALYGQTAKTADLVSAHSMPLTGLEAGRAYHYRVRSRDSNGNLATSADKTAAIGGSAAGSSSDDSAKARAKFLTPARADGYNDKAIFGPNAAEVTIVDVRGKLAYRARKAGANIVWDCRDGAGRIVESGVYIARIKKADGGAIFQTLAVVK